MKKLTSAIILILLTLSIDAISQGLIINLEKVIKTENLDSTSIFSEAEFSNISPYTSIIIQAANKSVYLGYSLPEVFYDSTDLAVSSITGKIRSFEFAEKVTLEDVKNLFIKGFEKEILIKLKEIDTEEIAGLQFKWNVKNIPEGQYPFLIFTQFINNRVVSNIYKIKSIKKISVK